MSNTQKTLLERIEASAEILNGFGGGDTWRAEPLKTSIEGTWSIKRGTFGMADQLADVFAQVNFGKNDRQDAEGVTTPLPLSVFRNQVSANEVDLFDIGGCGCFLETTEIFAPEPLGISEEFEVALA
jgi:hypothetical protein